MGVTTNGEHLITKRGAIIGVGLAVSVGLVAGIWTLRTRLESTPLAPSSPTPSRPSPAIEGAVDMAVGFGSLWVTAEQCTDASVTSGQCVGTLDRIDLGSQRVLARLSVRSPTYVAVGVGSVWVSDFSPGGVTRATLRSGLAPSNRSQRQRLHPNRFTGTFELKPYEHRTRDGCIRPSAATFEGASTLRSATPRTA